MNALSYLRMLFNDVVDESTADLVVFLLYLLVILLLFRMLTTLFRNMTSMAISVLLLPYRIALSFVKLVN